MRAATRKVWHYLKRGVLIPVEAYEHRVKMQRKKMQRRRVAEAVSKTRERMIMKVMGRTDLTAEQKCDEIERIRGMGIYQKKGK